MKNGSATRRPEEPKVTCPVCGDTEKEKDYKAEIGMCSRCRDYLSTERGGADHGQFMIRTETWDDQNGRRIASIRPRGFWSGTIEVREQLRHSYNPDTKEIEKCWEVEISWGSGGPGGARDQVQAAENFTRAMDHAVMIAKPWRTERQEKKED